jgi:hypothetical protein
MALSATATVRQWEGGGGGGVPADDVDGGVGARSHAQMREGAEVPGGKRLFGRLILIMTGEVNVLERHLLLLKRELVV